MDLSQILKPFEGSIYQYQDSTGCTHIFTLDSIRKHNIIKGLTGKCNCSLDIIERDIILRQIKIEILPRLGNNRAAEDLTKIITKFYC